MRASAEQMSAKTSGNSIMDNMSCLGPLAEFLVRTEFVSCAWMNFQINIVFSLFLQTGRFTWIFQLQTVCALWTDSYVSLDSVGY